MQKYDIYNLFFSAKIERIKLLWLAIAEYRGIE